MKTERTWPVTLKVSIEAGGLKRVVDEGRLVEFIDAFSTLAAGHIKYQLVEQLAKAATGLVKIGEGVSIDIGYDIDDPYGTGPKPGPPPPPYIDTVPLPERGLRRIVREELERIRKL